MEKYIDMIVSTGEPRNIKKILLEAGLKKRPLKRDFSDGKVSVTVKEKYNFKANETSWEFILNLGISSENIDRAAKVYNFILEKKDEMAVTNKRFYFVGSNLYMENKK